MKRPKQESIFSSIEEQGLLLRSTPPAFSLEDAGAAGGASANEGLLAKRPFEAPKTFDPTGPAEEPPAAEPRGETFFLNTETLGSFAGSFVLVAPGAFLMGSPECETGRSEDETPHRVIITKAFLIQSAPVTQKLWKAVMEANPATFKEAGDDLPVESASWNECQEFIRRLNRLSVEKYRLPTEAEWEFACRAGSSCAFARGDICEPYGGRDPVLWDLGWYCANSGRKTRPVGRKNPNDWGLFDMHGNISEWCMDWYGAYQAEPATDPCGPASGTGKVVRGGSWFGSAKSCRSAARFHWRPNSKSDFIGLRLVREPF